MSGLGRIRTLAANVRFGSKADIAAVARRTYNVDMEDGRPEWDHAFAEKLQGSIVLVGVTFSESTGDRAEQFFGTVMLAIPNRASHFGSKAAGQARCIPCHPTCEGSFLRPRELSTATNRRGCG